MLLSSITKATYSLGFAGTAAAIDDPDVVFYEGYTCASMRNYTHYCNREVEAKIDEQSKTFDPRKRKQLVQELDLMLQQDVARPALYQSMNWACWYPHMKGYVKAANASQRHHRMEDVWLDK
ncbi:MAG: hypothetical protein ABIH03_03870 [Pseudomonadota bacterium]